MTVTCQILSVLGSITNIPKGSTIRVTSTTSGSGQIVEYEWYLDSTILLYNNSIITINTSILNIGVHILLLKAKDSCNNWISHSKSFNIIENNLVNSFNIQIV